MEENKTESTLKKKRHRSPNYPGISLKKAVELSEKIYAFAKTHAIPERVAHQRLDVKMHGSQGWIYVAALKAFGLIQITGKGRDREISITDAARHILLEAEDKEVLLKVAGLLPRVHKELWEYYYGDLPDDKDLKQHLVFNLQFNEESTGFFISQFRETISFAKLTPGYILDSDLSGKDGSGDAYKDSGGIEKEKNLTLSPLTPKEDSEPQKKQMLEYSQTLEEFKFTLPSGKMALYLPSIMTSDDFEVFDMVIKGVRATFKHKPISKEENDSRDNGGATEGDSESP